MTSSGLFFHSRGISLCLKEGFRVVLTHSLGGTEAHLLLLPTTSFPLFSEVVRKDPDGLIMRPDHEDAGQVTYLRR